MSGANDKNQVKQYLKITCSLTDKPIDEVNSDNNSQLKIFPDRNEAIYIAEAERNTLERTTKKLVSNLFTKNGDSATDYVPVDTKYIERLKSSKPTITTTAPLLKFDRSNRKMKMKAKTSLETTVVIPQVKRDRSEKKLKKIKQPNKLFPARLSQICIFSLIGACGLYSFKSFSENNLQNTLLEANNPKLSVKVLATSTAPPLMPVKTATPVTTLDYVKNDAISYWLSQNPNIAALAVRGDRVVIAAENRLLIANIKGDYQQENLNLAGIIPTTVTIAPDGKIAIGTNSGAILILNQNGELLQQFQQNGKILSLDFTAKSTAIVAANNVGELQIFSLEQNEKIVSILKHSGAINKVLVTEDLIIAAVSDKTIRVWNFKGQEIKLFNDNNEVFSLAISEDGNYLYSGNSRGIIRKWDYRTGKEIKSYSWQKHKISSLAIANNLLISGSKDRSFMVLDLNDRSNRKLFSNIKNYIHSVAISGDGKSIFVANKNRVNVWQKD